MRFTYLCFGALGWAAPVMCQSDAHWAVSESWAVSAVRSEAGRFPIVTFIPPTYLLYDLDPAEPDRWLTDPRYTAATTQDGVRVFLLHHTISSNTASYLGDKHVIFNTSHTVCRIVGCDLTNEADSQKIDAGESFALSQTADGVLRLESTRQGGEAIEGYVNQASLEELNRRGIITYADRTHPRLTVTRSIAAVPTTSCGQSFSADSVRRLTSDAVGASDQFVFRVFSLGTITETDEGMNVRHSLAYGSPNERVEFRVYEIQDNWLMAEGDPNHKMTFAAQVVFDCESLGAVQVQKRIKQVILVPESSIGPWTRVSLDPLGTPPETVARAGSAALFSVNTSEQYFDLMAELGRQFRNRALAGFFLAEFNRSCTFEDRNTDTCRSHDYGSP